MTQPIRSRYRVRFSKGGAMRFTGHLDLQRTWARWLRRTKLPLYYSKGYTPRPKIQIAMALPLGFSGEQELLDFWLERAMDPGEILENLRRSRPPGLQILELQRAPENGPALQTLLRGAKYRAALPGDLDYIALAPRIDRLLSAESAPRSRRGKAYDLRPLIEELSLREDDDGRSILDMQLSAGDSGTGRPDEVLDELDINPAVAHIRRQEILLKPMESK